MRYHVIAFFGGFLLDQLFGDPSFLPHPVRLIGKLIAEMERRLRTGKTEEGADGGKIKKGLRAGKTEEGAGDGKSREEGDRDVNEADYAKKRTEMKERELKNSREFWQGVKLAVLVPVFVTAVSGLLLFSLYSVHPYAGMAAECLMTYQILAAKCLSVESMKVCRCLREGDLTRARRAVSMIVGRDTERLDEEGVAKAAIETVAENTSDGVIAPMLYLALGGPVLGFFYKAVNTMDSMIGYRNEKYLYFGRAAAKLDDTVNYIPARISACLMMLAAFLLPGLSGREAVRIYRRDRGNHASPNAAQTEAVCAGALGVRLGGDADYFGKTVKKPYIGGEMRRAAREDIRLANRLMYGAAWLGEILCLLLLCLMIFALSAERNHERTIGNMIVHGGDIYRNHVEIDFSVNTNPLGTPQAVKAAMRRAIEQCGRYPDMEAEALKSAVSGMIGVPGEYLVFGNGASELFMAIVHGIRPKKTVIPVPSFYGYEYAAGTAESEILYYELKPENNFQVTEDFYSVLTEDTDLVFLANPNNPTGSLMEREMLMDLLRHCKRAGIYVVLDECFIEFCAGGCSVISELEKFDHCILVRAFTKIFSIPGVRLGYLICKNKPLLAKIAAQLPEWNLSCFAQEAGCACAGEGAFVAETQRYVSRERAFLEERLRRAGFWVYPGAANFILIHREEREAERGLYERLLEKGILIRNCENFRGLGRGYYRVAVKCREENLRLLRALEECC